MVPPEFANFFIASASAGGALVGLLFVAVSIAPEQIVAAQAPVERQAVAGSAFTALMNAFFISLFALIPNFNIGFIIMPFSFICLLTSLIQAWRLLRRTNNWQSLLRRAFLVIISFALYGLELWNAYLLFTDPSQIGYVYNLISFILGAFGLGLIRAWELLGVRRYGAQGFDRCRIVIPHSMMQAANNGQFVHHLGRARQMFGDVQAGNARGNRLELAADFSRSVRLHDPRCRDGWALRSRTAGCRI